MAPAPLVVPSLRGWRMTRQEGPHAPSPALTSQRLALGVPGRLQVLLQPLAGHLQLLHLPLGPLPGLMKRISFSSSSFVDEDQPSLSESSTQARPHLSSLASWIFRLQSCGPRGHWSECSVATQKQWDRLCCQGYMVRGALVFSRVSL